MNDKSDQAYSYVLEPLMEPWARKRFPDAPKIVRLACLADAAKTAYLVFTVGVDGDEEEDERLRDRWLRFRMRCLEAALKYP